MFIQHNRCFSQSCSQNINSLKKKKKNKTPTAHTNDTSMATTTTATQGDKPSSAALVPPPAKSKLTHSQQIQALEEAMEEEEHSTYLDSCDMGEDFWSARA